MTVTRAFRYELDPTVRQRRRLAQAVGTARYAFNWGLAVCKRRLDAGKPVPHAAEMHRLWNAEKPQRSWVYGVSKCCGQEALRDLDRAFTNFWRGRQAGRPVGFPRFRKKHGRRDAFRLTGRITVRPRSITLPRVGGVRTKEATEKFRGRILSATVSREADRWYVSLAVEVEREDPHPVEGPVAHAQRLSLPLGRAVKMPRCSWRASRPCSPWRWAASPVPVREAAGRLILAANRLRVVSRRSADRWRGSRSYPGAKRPPLHLYAEPLRHAL